MIDVIIHTEDFSLEAAYAQMRTRYGGELGAVAAFVGLVRDRNELAGDGDRVQSLTLEHYPGMTEDSIRQIIDQAQARWSLLGVHVTHRVGELRPQDQIVLVLAASRHRPDAFAAAEFIMDYLKTDAVIWKRETTGQGAQWLEPTRDDAERTRDWAQ